MKTTIITIFIIVVAILGIVLLLPKKTVLPQDVAATVTQVNSDVAEMDAVFEELNASDLDLIDSEFEDLESVTQFL
ncbi:MAG: hypothetical protein NZ889_02035 [Candidatus Pacearchaeota archaeon]|nr:hypothetical protein [Candidatus Pacearchaeota archaeon]